MWKALAATIAILGCAGIGGCNAPADGEEEIWDEGPLGESAINSSADALEGEPRFELPFPCGQAWTGQTRTNHSPQNSIDFNRANDQGDVVSAAAAGTVRKVQNLGSRSYGLWIEISHGNGWTSRYAHLSATSVSPGQAVAQGEKIGLVGNTGGSSGAHLHFETRKNGASARNRFGGEAVVYFGTKTYTSRNACGGTPAPAPRPTPPPKPNPDPPRDPNPTPTSGAPGTVDTNGKGLTIRSGPGLSFSDVGSVPDGTPVTITCQTIGEPVIGTFGTSTLWDNIGNGFVSDAFVSTGSDGRVAPECP